MGEKKVSIDEMLKKYADKINEKRDKVKAKADKIKEKASKVSTALQPTKKKGLIAGIIAGAFISVVSMFSSVVGSAKSKNMTDDKFIEKTERTIDEFETAVINEDLDQMYEIIHRTEEEMNKYGPSDYAMVSERVADALNEKALVVALAEIKAGRIKVDIPDNVRYAVSALKDMNGVSEMDDAQETLNSLGMEKNRHYYYVESKLQQLDETCSDTIKRLDEYEQADDFSTNLRQTVDELGKRVDELGKRVESALQNKEDIQLPTKENIRDAVRTVRDDFNYIFDIDSKDIKQGNQKNDTRNSGDGGR